MSDMENTETIQLCEYMGMNSNILQRILHITPDWVREHEPDIYWIKMFVLQNIHDDEPCSEDVDRVTNLGFTKEAATDICMWIKKLGRGRENFLAHQSFSYWIDFYLSKKYDRYMEEHKDLFE